MVDRGYFPTHVWTWAAVRPGRAFPSGCGPGGRVAGTLGRRRRCARGEGAERGRSAAGSGATRGSNGWPLVPVSEDRAGVAEPESQGPGDRVGDRRAVPERQCRPHREVSRLRGWSSSAWDDRATDRSMRPPVASRCGTPPRPRHAQEVAVGTDSPSAGRAPLGLPGDGNPLAAGRQVTAAGGPSALSSP